MADILQTTFSGIFPGLRFSLLPNGYVNIDAGDILVSGRRQAVIGSNDDHVFDNSVVYWRTTASLGLIELKLRQVT